MIVRPLPHNLTLGQAAEGYIRSPGPHMSDLYGSLYKALDPQRYDKRRKDGTPEPMDMVKVQVGTTFEQLLEEALARVLLGERPGEFTTQHDAACTGEDTCECCAGIVYSPDYLFFDDHETVLGEFKCTWYSMKNAPWDEKFDKWMTQIKSYLYHLKLTKARLYVLFLNGDYKPPAPQLLAWELQFTERELWENWAMLKRHAREVGMVP